MINIARCVQDIRLFKAVTGMTYAEFNALLPSFVDALEQRTNAEVSVRQRQAGGGRTHTLPTGREKLFFLVFYVKCSATFDVLAWLFDVDRAPPPSVGDLLSANLGNGLRSKSRLARTKDHHRRGISSSVS